jgi:uncharacterized protein YbbK (DUF523 family)
MKTPILVSACLLGKKCRYDGGHCISPLLSNMDIEFLPVCPEEAGGLGTPRNPAELQGGARELLNGKGTVNDIEGSDCTQAYIEGSKKELQKAQEANVKTAILKSRSPACGCGEVYDGTFTGKLIRDNGIFTQMCQDEGINIISSDDSENIIEALAKE